MLFMLKETCFMNAILMRMRGGAWGLPYVAISRAIDLEKVELLLPIRPDHFINKHFIAENININEFYNNLNKKFNTDEEI
jgi:hypothetical protein